MRRRLLAVLSVGAMVAALAAGVAPANSRNSRIRWDWSLYPQRIAIVAQSAG